MRVHVREQFCLKMMLAATLHCSWSFSRVLVKSASLEECIVYWVPNPATIAKDWIMWKLLTSLWRQQKLESQSTVSWHSTGTQKRVHSYLGKLSCFSRPCFTNDNDNLIVSHNVQQLRRQSREFSILHNYDNNTRRLGRNLKMKH